MNPSTFSKRFALKSQYELDVSVIKAFVVHGVERAEGSRLSDTLRLPECKRKIRANSSPLFVHQ